MYIIIMVYIIIIIVAPDAGEDLTNRAWLPVGTRRVCPVTKHSSLPWGPVCFGGGGSVRKKGTTYQ